MAIRKCPLRSGDSPSASGAPTAAEAPCNTPGVIPLPHQIAAEERREAEWQKYMKEKGSPELDATIAEVCARWGVKNKSL